ncbi:MAG: beta-galactosidase [Firmicutes bacterium]|nr:beta-galactosidase [Bacillota bacterium]
MSNQIEVIKAGVDYYPEHWDRSIWESDIELMLKSGVKVVRLAEFAWSRLEPTEGKYDFEWLDDIISRLTKAKLEIILGTPTSCPPVWMYRKYEEVRHTEKSGLKTATGIRGHRCWESPVFLKFSQKIISQMAKRYATNSNIIAWQLDNELESNSCNCDNCTSAFREHLKKKFNGDIKKLNLAYGLDVWSGEYSNFDEIITPIGAQYKPGWLNPSYMLEHARWASESTAKFVDFQIATIRKEIPKAFITTNSCFTAHTPDFHKIFDRLNVAAYDNYPSLYKAEDGYPNADRGFILDWVRGLKDDNFWLLEQVGGSFGCWAPISPAPKPSMMDGYAWQAVGHGANLIMFFRWRTATKGAEMFCHGLLEHHGIPGRRFNEFAKFCTELNALEIPTDTVIKSDVALLYSSEQDFAFRVQEMSAGFTYRKQVELLHSAFRGIGVNVDVINESADIGKYKVVLLPTHFVSDDLVATKLEKFVSDGGTVVITNRSGVKDKHGACLMHKLPGDFAKICCVTVAEYDAIGEDTVPLIVGDKKYTASTWNDILELCGAKAYAIYDGEYYKGQVAASKNFFGKGTAYYLGTVGDMAFYRDLAIEISSDTKITHDITIPKGLDVITRNKGKTKYTFIFNNSYTECEYKRMTFKPFESKVIIL